MAAAPEVPPVQPEDVSPPVVRPEGEQARVRRLRWRRRTRLPRHGRHGRRSQRGLRVQQRLWTIDPWSVFKISVLFYLSLFLVVLVAGTLLWNLGRSSGTIDRVEDFITGLGAYGTCVEEAEVPEGVEPREDDDCPNGQVRINGFELDDGTIFRAAAIGGGILVVAGSIGNVLMVVLLNLIHEVTGGLRHTMVKEPVRRPPPVRAAVEEDAGDSREPGPPGD